MKNYFEKNKKENFESMDSTFTPIERADSRTRQFWPLHLKSKIYEVKDSRSRRFEEVEDMKFETQPESATRIESQGLLTRVCPSGTRGLVYRVRPIKEVDQNKDSKVDLE
jgi:hypothetical protein